MNVKISDLEKYMKEIKRKHISQKGFRVFENNNLNSAVYLVKDRSVKLANKTILRDNAKTDSILENFNKLQNATY